MEMTGLIFVVCFCALVYLMRDCWHVTRTPEFKREHALLRDQRRRRKSAKRGGDC